MPRLTRLLSLTRLTWLPWAERREQQTEQGKLLLETGQGTESPFYKACVSVLEDFDGRVKFLHFVHRDEQDC